MIVIAIVAGVVLCVFTVCFFHYKENELEFKKQESEYAEKAIKEKNSLDIEKEYTEQGRINWQKEIEKTIQIAALFPLMGEETDTFFLRNLNPANEKGFLIVNDSMETSIPGLFAAGDIVKKRLRQVVTALADGAVASSGIISYLRSHKG